MPIRTRMMRNRWYISVSRGSSLALLLAWATCYTGELTIAMGIVAFVAWSTEYAQVQASTATQSLQEDLIRVQQQRLARWHTMEFLRIEADALLNHAYLSS
jgi:hypothetical protein